MAQRFDRENFDEIDDSLAICQNYIHQISDNISYAMYRDLSPVANIFYHWMSKIEIYEFIKILPHQIFVLYSMNCCMYSI